MLSTLRRLRFFTWLLALPLLGTALPHAAVWRCAHATQLVTLLPSAPSAMPCRMVGRMPMACCRTKVAAAEVSRASISHAPCRPTLTPAMSALACLAPARPIFAGVLATLDHFLPARSDLQIPLRVKGSTQRGPPDLSLASLTHVFSHGLRAPPSA